MTIEKNETTKATTHTPTSASSRTVNGPTPYCGACRRSASRLGLLDVRRPRSSARLSRSSLPAALARHVRRPDTTHGHRRDADEIRPGSSGRAGPSARRTGPPSRAPDTAPRTPRASSPSCSLQPHLGVAGVPDQHVCSELHRRRVGRARLGHHERRAGRRVQSPWPRSGANAAVRVQVHAVVAHAHAPAHDDDRVADERRRELLVGLAHEHHGDLAAEVLDL